MHLGINDIGEGVWVVVEDGCGGVRGWRGRGGGDGQVIKSW